MEHFVEAQRPVYRRVLRELREGQKQSHWMWFIFPQHVGLGRSATAQHYGLRDLEAACSYLEHPVLGERLRECSTLLLGHRGRSAVDILGFPDDLKLRSSMTLFALADGSPGNVFEDVLTAFYAGERDEQTLLLLGRD